MRVIRYTGLDGSKNYSAFPTTTKELRRIFLSYGIDAWLMKLGGKYDICYPNSRENGCPVFISTGVGKVDAFTAKRWLELAASNAPKANISERGIVYDGYKWWGNLNQYIDNETLN